MKKRDVYKAVFSTKIDLRHSDLTYERTLLPGHFYNFEGNNNKVSYNEIVEEAVRIIDCELKKELQKYIDISVKDVEVQAVYEGSIEIIFKVVLGIFELAGGLTDLHDAICLVRMISERYINKKLSDKFGQYFSVDTYVILPNNYQKWGKMEDVHEHSCRIRRDAFFYYLLVANIVLLVIVATLIFNAVKIVYFRG